MIPVATTLTLLFEYPSPAVTTETDAKNPLSSTVVKDWLPVPNPVILIVLIPARASWGLLWRVIDVKPTTPT